MEYSKTVSFWVKKGKGYTVEVRCWPWSGTEWAWNVYAHVFPDHPLFENPNMLIDLAPLSGGCTLGQEKTIMPIGGVKYDWQKIEKSLTVGCDYKHIWDDDYSMFGPERGIPKKIEMDALELARWLEVGEVRNEP